MRDGDDRVVTNASLGDCHRGYWVTSQQAPMEFWKAVSACLLRCAVAALHCMLSCKSRIGQRSNSNDLEPVDH